MTRTDANYKIMYVDVGCKRRISQSGVFNECNLSYSLATNSLNITFDIPLQEFVPSISYEIVADVD